MTSWKALLGLLLYGCASGSQEQVAFAPAPTAARPLTETAPAPLEPAPPPPSTLGDPMVLQQPAREPASPTEPARSPGPAAPAAPQKGPGPAAPGVGPSVLTAPPGSPERPYPGAVWPPPGGWNPPPCEIEASTVLVTRGAVYEITARLRNRSTKPIEVVAPDRCPQGPAYFHGLGENYDYYGTCAAGACAAPRPSVRLRIPAGKSLDVATIRVDPAGNGCNPPLEPGAYAVSFGIPNQSAFCGGPAAQFERKSPTPPARPVAPAKKCPPQPACGIACPGGDFARDENGCSTCGCAKGPSAIAPSEPGRPPPAQ